MIEVICDTNFLIHLATKRIKNFDIFDIQMGSLKFLVPLVVEFELIQLKTNKEKQIEIQKTLDYIKNFDRIPISGTYADKEIINFIKLNRSFVGTMDKELKLLIKKNGSSIISFNNDFMILES